MNLRSSSDIPRKELFIAPACEAALVLAAALTGWAIHQPLIFTSLGPTAYEMIEMPHLRSARPYNVIVGHLLGVVSGFAALLITHAWSAPAVSTGDVTLRRALAAGLAALLTVLFTMLAKASQPAAISTTLLIALGTMQAPKDAIVIMAAVLLMALLGEPLRRWRKRTLPKLKQT